MDGSMYYSDEHRRWLWFCAGCANRVLWDRAALHVDPEELAAEGWWRCLRRLPDTDLKAGITNTIKAMVDYALRFYVRRAGLLPERPEDLALAATREPDPAHYVDLSDEIGFLQEHLDKAAFRLVQNLATGAWSIQKAARQEHLGKDTICRQQKQTLQKARRLLEVA